MPTVEDSGCLIKDGSKGLPGNKGIRVTQNSLHGTANASDELLPHPGHMTYGGMEMPLRKWLAMPFNIFLMQGSLNDVVVQVLDAISNFPFTTGEIGTIVTPDLFDSTMDADKLLQILDEGI